MLRLRKHANVVVLTLYNIVYPCQTFYWQFSIFLCMFLFVHMSDSVKIIP